MKHNKKGFTLIEMMVVIAIVAVLVSVIVPVVLGSTDKAAAATNAANLRSMEGQLISMMLIEPGAFENGQLVQGAILEGMIVGEEQGLQTILTELQKAIEDTDKVVADYEQQIKDTDQALKNLRQTALDNGFGDPDNWTVENANSVYESEVASHEASCSDWRCAITGHLIPVGIYWAKKETKEAYIKEKAETAYELANLETVKAQKAAENEENKKKLAQAQVDSQNRVNDYKEGIDKLYRYDVDADGYITLKNGNKIPVPSAEKVNIGDVNCEKGTPMTIYVNQDTYECVCRYGDYYKHHFAAVAE